MTTSENPQTGPISIQLPRLFPHSDYQLLSDPPSTDVDILPQTSISSTIPPNTNPAVQTDLVRPSAVNVNRGRSAEAQFKESFDRFYQKYRSNQAFTLMFFSILTSGYSLQAEFEKMLCFLLIFDTIYVVSLLTAFCGKNTMIDSLRATYKILECLVAHVLIWGFNRDLSDLFPFLMISYLIKVVAAYFSNRSELVKFTNQVNKKILGIRICIFIQGILIIHLRIHIPFVLKFMPFYVIILAIFLFTANLIKSVYFTYDADSRFRRTMNENKSGVKWIFGNLFGLIAILILQASLLLIDEIEGVFNTWVFVAVLLWCFISLTHSVYCYNEVFKICESLAILLETNGYMPTNEEIKYVTRISNTYFRPATEQEINNFNNETASENDLEAGVENNVEEEQPKCIVCCKESASAVFMKCGHGGVCFECGMEINKQQKECHMCRQKIKDILEINIMKANKNNLYEIVQTISNQKKELCWDNINF